MRILPPSTGDPQQQQPTWPSPKCFFWVHRTALHSCADLRIVKLLLAAGAKLNRLDHVNVSPLCVACLYNKIAKSRMLLEWRADVNGASPFTWSSTPLMIACSRGHHDLASLVRRARLRAVSRWGCGAAGGWGGRMRCLGLQLDNVGYHIHAHTAADAAVYIPRVYTVIYTTVDQGWRGLEARAERA